MVRTTYYICWTCALAFSGSLLFVTTGDAQTFRPTPARRPGESVPNELGTTRAKPLAKPGVTLAADAFKLSKSASTIEEYTEIIGLCEQTLAVEQDETVRKYAQQLLAWAANRRGEAFSQSAAKLNAANKTQEALRHDEQALTDFTTAVQNDPTKWKSLHNRGVSLALIGQYEDALAELTAAIELKSDYVNTWFNRAEVRYELGQYDDAAADYSEVIQRQPDDFGAFTGRGHAHFRMGDLQKALADYHRAVTLDQKSAGALINRGDTYRQLGQYEKAAADYRAAVKIDDQYGRAYRAAAWLMATCPNDKLRNSDLAVRAAEKAIELDGASDYLYLDTLAAAYANAGNYSEAVQTLEQAIGTAPEDAKLPLEQRLSLYQSGKPYRLTTPQTAGRPTPATR